MVKCKKKKVLKFQSTCPKTKVKVQSKANIKGNAASGSPLRADRRNHPALDFTHSGGWNRGSRGVMARWSQAAGGMFKSGLKMMSSECFIRSSASFAAPSQVSVFRGIGGPPGSSRWKSNQLKYFKMCRWARLQ